MCPRHLTDDGTASQQMRLRTCVNGMWPEGLADNQCEDIDATVADDEVVQGQCLDSAMIATGCKVEGHVVQRVASQHRRLVKGSSPSAHQSVTSS